MTIIEELRQDRESGAKRLESEYKAGLMTLARRLYADPSDAEELVNRTFAAVVDGIDGFLEQSSLFTWMCQILTNLHAKDVRRKAHGVVTYPGVVPDVADEEAEERVFRNLDASLLHDAIEALPPDLKKAIILHYFMEMPVREAARILSVPAGTFAWRLHCARDILAAKMGAAAKKPGGKAVLLALLLCGVAALGAGVAAIANGWGERSEQAAEAAQQQADNSNSPTATTFTVLQQPLSEVAGSSQWGAERGAAFSSQGEQNMNITAKSTAASLAALAIAATPSARASMDDWRGNATSPAVVIIVDVDMSLSDAIAANGVNLADAASLVKLGNGTVTVDDASGIGSFAGDIHVFKGGWSVGTAAGFGTTAGSTWVYPSGCVLVTDVTVAHTGEIFHLAGTGISDWYGWGAIRFPSSSQESAVMAVGAYGSRWILEGDATVLVSGNGNGGTFLPAIDLELNGHELTLWRGRYGTISTYNSSTAKYGMFNSVTGAGGIVMENGVTFNKDRYGFKPSSYTAGNYLALQNAYLGIWETKNLHANWGLVAKPLPQSNWNTDPNSGTAASHKPMLLLLSWKSADTMDHDFNRWQGPVTLQDDLQIAQENLNHIHPMTFTGKITGDGGLDVTSGKIWLYLDNPENDFQGGVTLRGSNDGLVLASDGALPADGGRLLLTDSTVVFPSTVSAPWSLPAIELDGASVVNNCQGSWKSVTALNGANASYNSALGASNLILKANSKLTVHSLFNPADYRGWEEYYDLDHSTTDISQVPYKGVQSFPRYFEDNSFRNLPDSNNATRTGTRTVAYSTYLWNNEPTNAVWTFAGHFGAHVYIWLNDQQILALTAGNSWRNPYRVTGTLHPGANKIVVLSDNNNYGATWDTNAGNDLGLWTGVNNKGFVYAVGDVSIADPADFDYPIDPGDGSFCTTKCGDETLDGIAWAPTFQNLAMEAGSTLCLDGALSVETAKGAGLVTNGALTVTQALNVDPTIFENNGGIAVDGDLVFNSGAKIAFADSDDYCQESAGFYTLATATGAITGFDSSMLELGGARRCWKVQLINSGRELVLELIPPATTFICK